MKQICKCVFLVSILLVLMSACGPSEEAIATMTASVWTPTPEPTLTPTPMPFDLEVSLVGEEGESIIFGAHVKATEHEEVMMDESGVVELLNLPVPEVEVSVKAQGYESLMETVTLEPGKNQVTLTLTADPLQINPVTACPEGAKVLYIEDFEDGFADQWAEGLNRPFWVFEDIEDRGKVATFTEENESPFGTMITDKQDYGNMLWKFDFKGGDTHFAMHGFDGQRKYWIIVQPGREGIVIIHDENQAHAAAAQRGYKDMEWTSAEISYFDGSVEFWLNGEFYIALDDPNPVEEGNLGFITHNLGAPFSLDNMVICELAEPYAPPTTEVAEE